MIQHKINSVLENVSLKQFNSFGVDVQANYFFSFNRLDCLINMLSTNKFPKLILGGGSNILFTKNFEGLILQPLLKGIEVINENNEECFVRVACGECWDEFVAFAVSRNWCGVENLSGIPGNVGACPVQNIGAYGVEVKNVIYEVEALELETFNVQKFSNADCKFEYRDSVFKKEFKGKYLITHVTFCLQKKHDFNLCYGDIETAVKKIGAVNLENIREAVLQIRTNKLPDPSIIGNAGSFFKNPVISLLLLKKIMRDFAGVPHYKISNSEFKIPAGWLIDQCGWKNFRSGNVGVHDKQALVLVNYGNATGPEILNLADHIVASVFEKFQIKLSMEVNII